MIKVLIDTDPGTDDALALMMALNSPDLDVQGVTTVGGNATLAHTTRNALRILEYLDLLGVPVSSGMSRPRQGKFHYGYYYHGAAGLGVRLPAPRTKPHPLRAPEFISKVAQDNRGELVVIALGPLTNIARALALEPDLARSIKELVIMGGAVDVPGNVTPFAEFNIYNDPLSASQVFESEIPVRLVGLDVCRQVYVSREEQRWTAGESKTARLVRAILSNWFNSDPERERYDLCDPLAVVAAIQPGLLSYKLAAVDVETIDSEQRGKTAARYGHGTVRVALGVDVERSNALTKRLLAADPS